MTVRMIIKNTSTRLTSINL